MSSGKPATYIVSSHASVIPAMLNNPVLKTVTEHETVEVPGGPVGYFEKLDYGVPLYAVKHI